MKKSAPGQKPLVGDSDNNARTTREDSSKRHGQRSSPLLPWRFYTWTQRIRARANQNWASRQCFHGVLKSPLSSVERCCQNLRQAVSDQWLYLTLQMEILCQYDIYFTNYSHFFIECNCNVNGSTSISCDKDGICSCKDYYAGNKCDSCKSGYYPFPKCDKGI